ncbi:unnamed protein product [Lactuca saligna]|uniref:Uncharacterized protein n=1 Tax=Lactuca saligna TaxID=75948 RepID=A0AA36E2I4_LACSI|nr:unnamed protein product [Lactuca saligna]
MVVVMGHGGDGGDESPHPFGGGFGNHHIDVRVAEKTLTGDWKGNRDDDNMDDRDHLATIVISDDDICDEKGVLATRQLRRQVEPIVTTIVVAKGYVFAVTSMPYNHL